MYDVIIIGGGPAGLAAAVYFARQKLSFALLSGITGGQTLWSSDVENYLGFHLLNGQELSERFKKHLEDYRDAFTFREGEFVQAIEKKDGGFRVVTDQGSYEARTLLIATGTKHRELGIPGEKEFAGKGVTYCATCDAPLFRDKIVHIVGGGNSAMDAALFAEKYASKVVIVTVNEELKGDDVLRSKVGESKKIATVVSTKTKKIVGEAFVTGVGLAGADGKERIEKTDGVFIEIGLIPVADFVDFVGKDRRGQIVVDKTNATDVEGIWAAGDVTDVTEKQIAVAVGEGSKAALSIIRYLQSKR